MTDETRPLTAELAEALRAYSFPQHAASPDLYPIGPDSGWMKQSASILAALHDAGWTLAPAVTETDLRARIAAIPGETFGSGSDRWLRESAVLRALAGTSDTEEET